MAAGPSHRDLTKESVRLDSFCGWMMKERNAAKLAKKGFHWFDHAKSKNTSNLPIVRPKRNKITAKNHCVADPVMADAHVRRDTFLTWQPQRCKTAEELVDNGFYYSGPGDKVKCFSCGIETGNWSPEDDVAERHARCSESCQFLINQRGARFVSQVRGTLGVYRKPPPTQIVETVTESIYRPQMESNVVQAALAMPMLKLNLDVVQELVISRIKEGKMELRSVAELVAALAALELSKQIISQAVERKHLLTCKICLSDVVKILFLPCGHLVCCLECAAAMEICPMCRGVINQQVVTVI